MRSPSPLLIALLAVGCQPAGPSLWSGGRAAIDGETLPWEGDGLDVQALAWGDHDGDGDLDLAVARGFALPLPDRVYEAEGGQLTGTWQELEFAGQSRALAWGDCDGDGRLDLAVAREDGPNSLYRHQDGVLVPIDAGAFDEDTGTTTIALAWGDYDDDGDLDLATGVKSDGAVRLFENEGCDLQPVQVVEEIPSRARDLGWADVDQDGDLDLAVAIYDDGDPGPGGYLLLNTLEGGGPDDDPLVLGPDLGPDDRYSLAWADFDDDGDLDLAVTRWDVSSSIFRNDTPPGGAPVLTELELAAPASSYTAIEAADQDGDGALDLALTTLDAEGVRLLTGDGLDFELAWTSGDNRMVRAAAWGDVDGDGLPELAVGDEYSVDGADQPAVLFENEGLPLAGATVVDDSPGADRCAAADQDGDGDPDLALVVDGELQVWGWQGLALADGAPAWSETRPVDDLSWADVDGAGGLDLVVAGEDGAALLLADDDGWAEAWSSSEPATAAAMADWDGDGDLDLAVAGQGGLVLYAAGLPDGLALARVWSSGDPVAAAHLAWADLDGDGDPDLFAAGGGGSLWLNDGPGAGLRLAWTGEDATDARHAVAGDLDRDGIPELALADADGDVLVYRWDPEQALALDWRSDANDRATALAIGDLDGDGHLDLAAGGARPEDPVRVYRNGEDDVTDERVLEAAGALWEVTGTTCLGLADLDRDGDADLRAVGAPDGPGIRLALGARSGSDLLPDGPTRARLEEPDWGAGLAGPLVGGGEVEVTFSVVDRESDPAAEVRLWYSVTGQEGWRPATVSGSTEALVGSPTGEAHALTWRAEEDLVSGDDVRLRLEVVRQVPRRIGGPLQAGALWAESGPFRVRVAAVVDGDGDGWIGSDCDDDDPAVHPGAEEICDGLDTDCDGSLGEQEADADADGAPACLDCDDDDPAAHPGAAERCNGLDDDCDGLPGAGEVDGDGDLLLACADCDDERPVEASEVGLCRDGLDNDCDGRTDRDDPDCWWGCAQAGGASPPLLGLLAGVALLLAGRRRRLALPALLLLLAGSAAAEEPVDPLAEASAALDAGRWEQALLLAGPETLGERASRALLIQGLALEALDQRPAAASFFKAIRELTPSPEVLAEAHAGIERTRQALHPAPGDGPARANAPTLDGLRERLEAHMEAGHCQAARATAWEATWWRPDLAESWRLTGTAARCLRKTRDAVLAYRRYAELGGTDTGVLDLTEDLASRLGVLEVSVLQPEGEQAPSSMLLELPGADPVAGTAAAGTGRLLDLPLDQPMTLRVSALGRAPVTTDLEPLAEGERRALEVSLPWVGTGTVRISDHPPDRCRTTILAEAGPAPSPPGSEHAVTAGTLVLRIEAAEGTSEVSFELTPGQLLEIDPTRHLPAALTVAEVPAGSELRVFVEGPDGTGVQQRARLPRLEGTFDPETGVRLAPPARLESLAGGSGGLFVDHPSLGQGNTTVTLVAGEVNVATFDWRALEGVPAVRTRYQGWLASRAEAQLRADRGRRQQVAGAVLAGVGLALMGGAGATWGGLSATRRAAEPGADLDELQATNQALRPLFVGLAAGGGVALGLGGVQIGLGGHARTQAGRELEAIGPWDPDAAD